MKVQTVTPQQQLNRESKKFTCVNYVSVLICCNFVFIQCMSMVYFLENIMLCIISNNFTAASMIISTLKCYLMCSILYQLSILFKHNSNLFGLQSGVFTNTVVWKYWSLSHLWVINQRQFQPNNFIISNTSFSLTAETSYESN